jgi:hypothetical protein
MSGLQDLLLILIIPDLSEGTVTSWWLKLDLSWLELIQGFSLELMALL